MSPHNRLNIFYLIKQCYKFFLWQSQIRMQHFINKCVKSGFRITFLFDKEEGRFILVEIFNKNKKATPDKNRINDLFKEKITIQNELYNNEKEYLK